ncbi:stage II sporulation protein R [Paraliobacillus zengyii]|uniref:stage II sporulation protein R n=1 Tax=Paraliobacillus zengyii TaxID=2213194 RepID=UPI000DD4345B|nr:stage II sporulation protein R [Paraliobacillus zengyii]
MKKIIPIIGLLAVCITLFSMQTFVSGEETVSEEAYQVIPDEAIRLRILANSDQDKDQQIKRLVRDEVNEEITTWVEDLDDIDVARELIESRLDKIEEIVRNTLQAEGIEMSSEVSYGKNVNFPDKVYGSYVYPAGEYEAIMITLGEGKGANWWCVLFPPLCFLDFSNGTSVAAAEEKDEPEEKEEEDVEVKFFLFEWFS